MAEEDPGQLQEGVTIQDDPERGKLEPKTWIDPIRRTLNMGSWRWLKQKNQQKMIQMNHKRESHYKIILKAEKDLDKPKKLVPKTLDETKSEKPSNGEAGGN